MPRFEKVGITFRFLDENLKKRTLNAKCTIEFTQTKMNITAKKYLNYIKKHKNFNLPSINERNFHRLLSIAKENRVSWVKLMHITFNINNVSIAGYVGRPAPIIAAGSINLLLQVSTPHKMIGLELGGGSGFSGRLREIEFMVKKYSSRPVNSQLEFAERYFASEDYDVAAEYFLNAALICEEVENFEAAERHYLKAIESSYSTKQMKPFKKFIKSRILKSVRDPIIKIELLRQIVTYFLGFDDIKNATSYILRLKKVFEKKPLNDQAQATFYENLANQIQQGIENTPEGTELLDRIDQALPSLPNEIKQRIVILLLMRPKEKREVFLKSYLIKYRDSMRQS